MNAYAQGRQAAIIGAPYTTYTPNPFGRGVEHDEWEDGWYDIAHNWTPEDEKKPNMLSDDAEDKMA